MTALLAAKDLAAGYDGHPVVHGFDLEIREGEVIALLGPNGAGKSTTMLTLAGDLPQIGGTVEILGQATTAPLHRRAKRGLAFVTEERSVLMGLTVAENLRLGRCDIARVLALFPELERLMNRRCGLLSGGEQQIVTLARALARRPRVLLADELSLGLAPLIVKRLLQAVRQAADEDGIGVLLVEQHVTQVLRVADRAYVMRRGRVVLSGDAADVSARVTELESSYIVEQQDAAGAADPVSQ
ncbi:MAG TPA: ATP-binding cassette domain-containing protein [Baekduia sp.]|uniref:ABC transporter ATP-binding protein n=1 Tax=Baekduia sp. TaxID=2600305 RepID=UPI002D7A3744|nr:ATP-binding cassette domain-containing protein [Baekduia sp.]HET6509034.1 ATP-binding cassette domain-containing protein [Baekduia sp.]